MIAAIYARKSSDDSDRSAEARSTQRQVENATRYARAKAWTVDPRYIDIDDAVSGAEWNHRPGFNALLAVLDLSFAKVLSGSLDERPCVSGGLETLETGTRPEVRVARRRPYPAGTRFFGSPRTIRKDDGSSRRELGREEWPV